MKLETIEKLCLHFEEDYIKAIQFSHESVILRESLTQLKTAYGNSDIFFVSIKKKGI